MHNENLWTKEWPAERGILPCLKAGLILAAAFLWGGALLVPPAQAVEITNQASFDQAVASGNGQVVMQLKNNVPFDKNHAPVAGANLTGIAFNTGTVTEVILQGGYAGGVAGTPGEPVGKNALGNPNNPFLNTGRWMVTPSTSMFTLTNDNKDTTVVIQGFGIRGNDDIKAAGNRGDESHGGALWTQGALTIDGAGNFIFADNTINCGSIDKNATPAPSDGRIPAGYGAAIYADGDLLLTGSGTYTFQNNEITGGDAKNGAGNFKVAAGAALYVKGYFEISGTGTYVFEGNHIIGGTVDGGGDISGSGHQNGQGQGGAIDGTTLYFRGEGKVTFLDNWVQGGNAIGTNGSGTASRGMNGGLGGAILSFPYGSTSVLFENAGDYEFIGNKALGGNATGGATTNHSGLGGGIYTESLTIFQGSGEYLFEGNIAQGGNGTGGSDVTESGWGGAIAAALNKNMGGSTADLTFKGDGVYIFKDNLARGGQTDGSSDGADSGLGGAIYSDGSVTFAGSAEGAYTFTGNQAVSGNAEKSGGAVNHSGYGGAIYSSGLLTFTDYVDSEGKSLGGADYTFENNRAIGGIAEAASVGSSGRGGALYVDSSIVFEGSGDYLFIRNEALAGDAIGNGNAKSGVGGALYIKDDTTFSGSGNYIFDGNKAIAADATKGGNAGRSGQGGAINGNLVLFDGSGDYAFTNNVAQGGDASGAGSNVNTSGQGGAITSFSGGIQFTGADAIYEFSGNQAAGGNATDGGNVSSSGLGGALYAGVVTMNADNQYVFSGNIASGGSATGDSSNASLSGLGGAIYSTGALAIANASFTNNAALTSNTGDNTSGRGGAIYHTNNSAAGAAVTINASGGKDVLFSDNTQKQGNGAVTANSIYFGTTATSARALTNLNIDIGEGGFVSMLDPMASQEDGLNGSLGLRVDVTQTGKGTWVLAGANDMRAAGDWNITEGTLYLASGVTTAGGADTGVAQIDLSHDDSSFTLASGAILKVDYDPAIARIRATDITLATGSRIVLDTASIDFLGRDFSVGSYSFLELDGDNVANNATLSLEGATTFEVREYDYTIGANTADSTSFNVLSKSLNKARTGASAVTASAAIVTALPGSAVLADHARSNFLLPCEKRLGTTIWATGFYNYLDQRSGYSDFDVKVPGFAVGADHWFGNNFFIGVAGVFSWPDYESRDADVDGDDITGLIYGGLTLPYDVNLSFFGGFGRTSLDQDRRVPNHIFSHDYDSDNIFLGFGVSKDFQLSCNWKLTPFANYEYIHADVDGWREYSTHDYALDMDGYKLDMHRVKLGLEAVWEQTPGGAYVKGEAYYQGLYGDNRGEASAVFVNDLSARSFRVNGDKLDRNMLGLGIEAGVPLGENVRVYGGYDFKIGKDTLSHTGYLNIGVQF